MTVTRRCGWRDSPFKIPIRITDAMAAATAPMTTRDVAAYWHRFKPWTSSRSLEEMEAAVIDRVAELVASEGAPQQGVEEIMALSRSMGWRIGLASNSPLRLCHVVLRKLAIEQTFDVVVSADFVMRGKPDPAIYLYAARAPGVPARRCMAFEDSVSGVSAAKAAGMAVVAVPSAQQMFVETASVPDIQLPALSDFRYGHAVELWGPSFPRPRRPWLE